MKHFVAALACLTMITVFCTVGAGTSTDAIDEILGVLHHAPTDTGAVPPQAKETADIALALWEEKFFLISIFHPHQHLDEVKEKMIVLQSYSDTEEYAEWKQAHASLEEALLHLKGLLEANIDNIM